MTMAVIWTGMVTVAVVCALVTGQTAQTTAAALEGARAAVELCLSMGGMLCLWSGVMEVMERCGLAGKLTGLLRPLLTRLYPSVAHNPEVMDNIAANVSANLLGLGNAATLPGLNAARAIQRTDGRAASDALCMLVVCNTASIQLLPTTLAGVRSALGCQTPFDILPAVWLASLSALITGIAAAKLFSKLWRS